MSLAKLALLLGSTPLLLATSASMADDAAPTAGYSRCEVIGSGVEYRSYLPDQRRYVFVSVKVLKGARPSVFVLVDKNFDGKVANLSNNADPILRWWLDRSRPMTFSTDAIKVGWRDHSGWRWITSLVGSDNEASMAQSIRGLTPVAGHFEGTGSSDNNTFAFQSRIELADFDGDEFSVFVPAVSFDGVSVSPPVVHFTETDETPIVKC
jgi:hypothetical protein